MRVLFCGSVSRPWMSSAQRLNALRQAGADAVALDQASFFPAKSRIEIWWRGACPPDLRSAFQSAIETRVESVRPDLVWMEWPRLAEREWLQSLRKRHGTIKWVSFQDDNPFGARVDERPHWEHFIRAIPEFDLHFVKRTSDIAEYTARGARHVELFRHGTVPELFFPVSAAEAAGSTYDLSFIGSPLDRRVATINRLQGRHGFEVHVFGNRWNRTLGYYRRRQLYHPAAVEEGYRQVAWRSRINLGFVSHSNGDEYSMRSFELPACGSFFLAERTPAHVELYREGMEAEFFASAEECADKARYYLRDDEARRRIADAGCRRAHSPEYSLRAQVERALARCAELP